eukprot:358676-Chlamydomonas_euryale.AAC.1
MRSKLWRSAPHIGLGGVKVGQERVVLGRVGWEVERGSTPLMGWGGVQISQYGLGWVGSVGSGSVGGTPLKSRFRGTHKLLPLVGCVWVFRSVPSSIPSFERWKALYLFEDLLLDLEVGGGQLAQNIGLGVDEVDDGLVCGMGCAALGVSHRVRSSACVGALQKAGGGALQ